MAVLKKGDGSVVASEVEHADGFVKQAVGLMFRRSIAPGYAMIFDLGREQFAGVHMAFVPFSIDLAYLDRKKRVVDVRPRLRAWIGWAFPREPARYAIEMPAGTLDRYSIGPGDILEW